MADLLYSFRDAAPGLVALHSYPRFLQEFEQPDSRFMDLAATDILRTRELGVPRYCESGAGFTCGRLRRSRS